MAGLCGRAGRLTAKNLVSRPRRAVTAVAQRLSLEELLTSCEKYDTTNPPDKVRKTPGWVNLGLLDLYSRWNARANLHLLGQPNTFLA
jgi:hypothetical protein